VLADATRIAALLADPRVGDTVRNQFERCDLVLLNKTDLTDANATREASAAVAALRDGTKIVETSEYTMPGLPQAGRKATSPFRADAVPDVADHEQRFKRWQYRRRGAFDRAPLETALRALPPQLLRLKGHCTFAGDSGPSLLQMVGGDWSLTPVEAAERDILLVGVGTDDLPDPAVLDRILDRALATPPAFDHHGGIQSPAISIPSREGQIPCR